MAAYRAVFGHIGDILPGTHFESRKHVKAAGLHKEEQAGISWGRDGEHRRVADAIVLNNGYEDDRDDWDEILYTGAGGRNPNTGRQESDQTWDNAGNDGLRNSELLGHPVRVIRGSEGNRDYSPASGYRYDGLYRLTDHAEETGSAGFRILRFKLRRLLDDQQELTPLEQQVDDLVHGAAPRKTATVERIVRDTAVGRRVKQWYGHRCQICRLALPVGPDGKSYAEGAHIQALGPAGGPDVEGNVLCLCPNCHVRLDRGAIYLTDTFQVVDRFSTPETSAASPLWIHPEHDIKGRFARAHRRFWKIIESLEER
ncbi:YDG/SRA domain-containing protein [Streptomyces sp. NPDC127092]|uniref:YDG/SRA domain-containing protein n=1 Tax=Streptomyces sp. NPDC127092 TaxID=3347135 RepID=UPI00364A2032